MIGSGVFIVAADIARGVDSPALFIGAWIVTAIMTIIGALSYGELAAMMPRAGGQYVYLREALGPLWGFLYGWTLFLVIQTGTIAAVAVAFGKFLGVFFPSVSATNWIWHIAHVPPWHVGPMVLGNMDIGLNTANLAAIVIVILLAGINVFGVKMGALVQNVFTTTKTASLLGLIFFGLWLGRDPVAMAANFGAGWHAFWHNAGFSTMHPVQVGVGGPTAMVGFFTVLAVVQVGSLFSADAWNNVTFTAGEVRNPQRNLPLSLAMGTGPGAADLYPRELRLPLRAAAAWRSGRRNEPGARYSICVAGPRRHGSSGADISFERRLPDGGCDPHLDVWLRQRYDHGRRSRLLRHEPRRSLLQGRRQTAPTLQDSRGFAGSAGCVDVPAVPFGLLWAVAGLHDLRSVAVLYPHDWQPLRLAHTEAAG